MATPNAPSSSLSGSMNSLTVEQVWNQINFLNNHMHFQLESPFDVTDPSGLVSSSNVLQYLESRFIVGENMAEDVGAPRASNHIRIFLFRPKPPDEEPVEVRRENQVVINISITPEPDVAELPWKLLKVAPDESSTIRRGQTRLALALQVHGTTTGKAFRSACHKCATKGSSAPPNVSLFDFAAKDGLVGITGGTARVAFRFRCLPYHHGTTDREYRLTAILSDRGRILSQHIFPNWFRVVHHLSRRKKRPTTALPSASVAVDTPGVSEKSHCLPLLPLPDSQSGSHHMWKLLEASRDNWNPNELEPMTSNGISPLLEFTERREGAFYCVVPVENGLCNYSNNNKGRMLSHIWIKHLNFKPFPCRDAPANVHVSDGSSSGTSAGDSLCLVPPQPSSTPAQSLLARPAAPISRSNEEPEPEWEGSGLSVSTARGNKRILANPPVLSHMNPKRGPTKGGEEIYLIVRNVPLTAVLYARFGGIVVSTSHIAQGVLSCVLPAAAHPGVVDVTLCQAPSVREKAYGTSLVSFEYEVDTSEALFATWWNADYGGNGVGTGITLT